MSTTELNDVWFAQPAIAQSVGRESNIQLSENQFDPSTTLIDVASISQQALKRFEKLRAIKANDEILFPVTHLRPADHFGDQFLSHAVYASLLDQHVFKLRAVDQKLLHHSVLGEVQTRFYMASSPEWFFYDRAQWDSRTLKKQVQKFLIGRPHEKVRDYIYRRRIKVKREIETGGLTSKEYGIYEKFLEAQRRDADASRSGESPAGAPHIDSTSASGLIERFSGSESEISNKNLLKDFLDLKRVLNLVKHCRNEAVTPSDYQQFMIDWDKTPKPIRGATEIQKILWKWLYVSFPDDRNKYFHIEGESKTEINNKTQARTRRLKGLNQFLKNAVMRASL